MNLSWSIPESVLKFGIGTRKMGGQGEMLSTEHLDLLENEELSCDFSIFLRTLAKLTKCSRALGHGKRGEGKC